MNDRPWLRLHPQDLPAECAALQPTGIAAFKNTAASHAGSPAIHYFDGTLTYGEIDRASSSLAAAFVQMGVKKGDRVIVQLQNIPQFLIALYGAWKAGAAVVPLNPMYKERELVFYAKDSGARVFVTMESSGEDARNAMQGTDALHLITTSELDYLHISGEMPVALQNSTRVHVEGATDLMALLREYDGASASVMDVCPEDIAYLTYTSGTTGPPKGAMNTHGNLAYACSAYRLAYHMTSEDRVLAMAPFIHVTGSSCLLAVATLVGAPVIACFRFEPGEVLRLIEKWRATYTNGPLTAYISMLNHPSMRERDLSSLHKALSGGAPVAPGVAREFEEITGHYLHNTYGLTETTSPGIMTPLGVKGPVDDETGALSVGFPPPGSMAKVVDSESGADLPAGQIGEILLKGPHIVPGYWKKEEETAKAIRDGWLYTGDVGKMDAEGFFYIVDRKKDLINVSGFKVWPREVEDVLYQNPAVSIACVIGVPDAYRGETVKAFVALKRGHEATKPEELIDFCRQRMAAYKYPRQLDIVEEIPKTASGKMLKRQLREQEPERDESGAQPAV
ncbi:MAG: AMP-binding protein [Dehalococcoidia bacterium]|nr:AMP-binding protein [Dehalococcoidia bacterium]